MMQTLPVENCHANWAEGLLRHAEKHMEEENKDCFYIFQSIYNHKLSAVQYLIKFKILVKFKKIRCFCK